MKSKVGPVGDLVPRTPQNYPLIYPKDRLLRAIRASFNPKGPSTYESYILLNIELLNYYPKPKYLIIGSFGPLGKGPLRGPGIGL